MNLFTDMMLRLMYATGVNEDPGIWIKVMRANRWVWTTHKESGISFFQKAEWHPRTPEILA